MSTLYCISVEGGLLSLDGINALIGAADHLLNYHQRVVEIIDHEMQPRLRIETDFSEMTLGVVHGTVFKAKIMEDGKTVHTEFIVQRCGSKPREFTKGWELSAMVSHFLESQFSNN